ncbi:Inhibitor of vertebrate lysozyme precursor [compost metagenome]
MLGSDPAYREAWQALVEEESRLPEWVMNLTGTAPPMRAVEDEGDKFLVGQLCEARNCSNQRLYVAFSWNKEDAWALYVQVPDGMPSDKSPSRHASYRWLGEPDEEVRRILDEQLKADPNWY